MKHAGASFLPFALLVVLGGCEPPNQYAPPPPPTVTVSPPVRKEVIEYLEFTGTTEAVETVEIRARVKGFLEKIEFEEEDWESSHPKRMVEVGDPLFLIEQGGYDRDAGRIRAPAGSHVVNVGSEPVAKASGIT